MTKKQPITNQDTINLYTCKSQEEAQEKAQQFFARQMVVVENSKLKQFFLTVFQEGKNWLVKLSGKYEIINFLLKE